MPNEEIKIDTVASIKSAWGDISTSVKEVESPSRREMPSQIDSVTNLFILVSLILFMLIATDRILEGIGRSFNSILSVKRLREIDWELTLRSSRNTTMVFIILLLCFLISYNSQELSINKYQLSTPILYTITSLSIFLFLAIKGFFLTLLDYCNKSDIFRFINRYFRDYLIVSLCSIIIGVILFYLSQNLLSSFINIWILASLILPYIFYLVVTSVVILKNNFSVFFYILYICALEVLPIVLIVKVFSLL